MSHSQEFIETLYEYNLWADRKIISSLEENKDHINEKVVRLFSHVLNAQIFWYSRILKKEISIKVWDTYNLETLGERYIDNLKHIDFILKNYALDELIEYKNTKGIPFENSIGDILFHLFNHGNYHRGQINMELRQLGIEPPAIDFIFFRRG